MHLKLCLASTFDSRVDERAITRRAKLDAFAGHSERDVPYFYLNNPGNVCSTLSSRFTLVSDSGHLGQFFLQSEPEGLLITLAQKATTSLPVKSDSSTTFIGHQTVTMAGEREGGYFPDDNH